MANCNPITISNCAPANTCDACKEIIDAKCIKYTGSNLSSINANKNQYLDTILIDINNTVSELSGGPESACGVGTIPQACIKLHRNGSVSLEPRYNFFSCSGPVYVGCTKSYKLFDTDDVELYSGSLAGCTGFALGNQSTMELSTPYYIVEYINCGDCGTTESLNQCFQIINTEIAGRIIQNSCECCPR